MDPIAEVFREISQFEIDSISSSGGLNNYAPKPKVG